MEGVTPMLPSESKEYIENLFYLYPSRAYRLTVCREKMAYSSRGEAYAEGKRSGYHSSGISPDLLQLAIDLDKKIKEVEAILEALTDAEKDFVAKRYFDKLTMKLVSEELHVSRRELYNIRDRIFWKAAQILVIVSDSFDVPAELRSKLLSDENVS